MSRRFLLTVLLLVVLRPVSASVYYVDRNNGSDDADGRTPVSAWRSLAKAASQRVAAGDYVLLARGNVWSEPLVISSTGLPDLPITIGAYGTGPRPAIDGRQQERAVDLVSMTAVSNIVLNGLEIRNSARNGVNIYRSSQILIRNSVVSGSRQAGILTYDSSGIAIEDSEIMGNALDSSASYDGIRLDGSGGELSGFSIRNCVIHDQIGGDGWNSANGIFLGHTGTNIPTLHSVLISGNTIYANGNPGQNQAGRGISGTLNGDVIVTGNYVYRNASAGIYLGDRGVNVDLTFANNIFYNNALRQFGGFTGTQAVASRNFILVDDPAITAMGVEFGGTGKWYITNNAFYYTTPTDDTYRGFLRLNDPAQQQNLHSDWNLFYSAGPRRWKLADGIAITFGSWQSAGFDAHSVNPN
jgi:hypothetical protein